jgi:hypothetical protein
MNQAAFSLLLSIVLVRLTVVGVTFWSAQGALLTIGAAGSSLFDTLDHKVDTAGSLV